MIANILVAQQNNNVNDNDSTGLPGDNFSLQGALDMFKNSKTMDEFEKNLNTKNNLVNNLDLNGDGKIDYIKVIDKTDGKIHDIVLQDPVSKTESQDVAVIEIEKNGKESAILQIVGDEELYGDSTIIEPTDVSEVPTKDKGPAPGINELKVVIVNVWMWPCVEYIYAPAYVVWVSPWYWNYYPGWWEPWEPMPWYMHHSYCRPYFDYYHPAYVHRVYMAHNYYKPYRSSSMIVENRYKPAHVKYKENQPYKTNNKNTTKPPPKNNNNVKKNNPPNQNKNNNTKKNNGPKQNKGGGGGKRGK